MFTKRLVRITLPVVLALAALVLLWMALAVLADGPVIDTQVPNLAVSTVLGQTTGAKTGHAVATGDVNGDGYQDLIVGAPYADLLPTGVSTYCLEYASYLDCVSGGVYVYLGRATISNTIDLLTQPANVTFYATPNQWSGEQLGRSVAVGDINNDGLDDIVMGASNMGSTVGEALVWVGRDTITTTTAVSVNIYNDYNLTLVGAWVGDRSGWDVAVGDMNGDGFGDIVTSSPLASVVPVTDTCDPPTDTECYLPPDYQAYHYSAPGVYRTQSGAVYVSLGSSLINSSAQVRKDFMDCMPELTIYGRASNDRFGHSVAVGDIDHDGIDDLLVGADGVSPGGAAYVFYGSSALIYAECNPYVEPYYFANQVVKDLAYITQTADISITNVAAGAGVGYDVAVGNLNNDVYGDIIVGAPSANSGYGRVYAVYGGPRNVVSGTIPVAQANLRVTGSAAHTWLGSSVSAGDINHDGVGDLVMGAIGIDPNNADLIGSSSTAEAGAAYVLFGGRHSGNVDLGVGNPYDLLVLGAASDAWLGRGLATADLNGDGFSELAVGAASMDHGSTVLHTGAVYVVDLAYPQQITVTTSPPQAVAGQSVNISVTAQSWIGSQDVTNQSTLAISPGAGGSW